jgi:glycosyltransferase involved in cell wall biosynthesis
MKKLVIFNPSIESGGVEKNLELISNHLSARFKDKIYFLSYDNCLKLDKSINIIKPIIKINIKNRLFKYLICILSLFIFNLKNKNFIVFAFQANVYAILASKILKKKIIVRANAAPDKWINNYKLFIIRYFYKLADEVIVNSYEFKSEVKKKFNIKSSVIYNPINKKKLLKLSEKKLHFPFFDNFKNGLKILNIGRLTLQKNQIDLLKIVNVLKNKIPVKLLIIGSGNQIKFLKSYASEKRIKNIVKFLPYTKNPYIYFKKSNIFLLTSIYEGLPNVLLEATLFKNFCFSYQCKSGPKEILDQGKGGVLTNTRNYKKMASEIQKYYFNKSKNKYKQMIRTSFLNLEKYNLKKQLKKYERLIFIYLK